MKEAPEWLTECNCSLCRRVGALWCHAETVDITIRMANDATIAYVQGDKTLAVHTCKNCGCTTHWENLQPDQYSHMAVNFRMCARETVSTFTVRHFDGADSWEYLD